MSIPSFYHSLLCCLALSTSSAEKITIENRQFCGADFEWNKGLKDAKLFDDCMLQKYDLILSDAVLQITEKTECITSVYLMIESVQMDTNWRKTGRKLTSGEIKFKNGLPQELRQIPVKATFTATNYQRQNDNFVSQFDLDPTKCSGEERDPAVDDVNTSPNDHEDTAQNKIGVLPITAGVSSVILLVTVVTLVVWKKKKEKGVKAANNFHTDENHTYGTYSRGWEEGGEYGDGDKVYVTDSNDYYA